MGELTITEFLEARISEDEEAARAANVDPWWWEAKYVDANDPVQSFGPRFAPARVLAECAAKRAIIADYVERLKRWERSPGRIGFPGCNHYEAEPDATTVRALAAVYADHEDYRQEWAL